MLVFSISVYQNNFIKDLQTTPQEYPTVPAIQYNINATLYQTQFLPSTLYSSGTI